MEVFDAMRSVLAVREAAAGLPDEPEEAEDLYEVDEKMEDIAEGADEAIPAEAGD